MGFLRMARHDPATLVALRRVKNRLRAVSHAFQSREIQHELKCSRRAQTAAISKIAELLRRSMQAACADLGARGLPVPSTLEDWAHLARVIEMPFETVRSGKYTLQDVYVMALAWIDRQAVRQRMAAPLREQAPAELSITIAQLREWTGVGNTTLNRYAKLAGVQTPRRGQRNFRYSDADARKIMQTILAQASDTLLLARVRAALADMPKITK